MDIALGVVAHHARAEQAHQLQETIGAQFLSMDNGTLGAEGNHRRVWQYLAKTDSTHAVVLEDDAQPVDGFREQLAQALDASPTGVVSLYLGQNRPAQYQRRIKRSIQAADEQDACWLVAPRMIHAVGVAIQTPLIPDMLATIEGSPLPIDEAITTWCLRRHQVAYTWPSLVEHADGQPLVRHRYSVHREPRTAWRTGTRDTWSRTWVPIS